MTERPLRVFIGSSSEGKLLADNLQVRLEKGDVAVEAKCWDQEVFRPSTYALDSLVGELHKSDFAVLVATPDDIVTKRGQEKPAARDNVLLEFGLAAGILGRRRVFLLSPGAIDLPSDLYGLTWLQYSRREDGNIPASLTGAVLQIHNELRMQGPRTFAGKDASVAPVRVAELLGEELAILQKNAESQGWTYRRTGSAVRLRGPKGQALTLELERPEESRQALRRFAQRLRGHGLRVDGTLRRAPERSPLGS